MNFEPISQQNKAIVLYQEAEPIELAAPVEMNLSHPYCRLNESNWVTPELAKGIESINTNLRVGVEDYKVQVMFKNTGQETGLVSISDMLFVVDLKMMANIQGFVRSKRISLLPNQEVLTAVGMSHLIDIFPRSSSVPEGLEYSILQNLGYRNPREIVGKYSAYQAGIASLTVANTGVAGSEEIWRDKYDLKMLRTALLNATIHEPGNLCNYQMSILDFVETKFDSFKQEDVKDTGRILPYVKFLAGLGNYTGASMKAVEEFVESRLLSAEKVLSEISDLQTVNAIEIRRRLSRGGVPSKPVPNRYEDRWGN